MEMSWFKECFGRYWISLMVVLVLGLSGCQTQPTLETSQQWSRTANGSYVNNVTGRTISRNEYGKMVAAESYYFLSAREGNSNKSYCPR